MDVLPAASFKSITLNPSIPVLRGPSWQAVELISKAQHSQYPMTKTGLTVKPSVNYEHQQRGQRGDRNMSVPERFPHTEKAKSNNPNFSFFSK